MKPFLLCLLAIPLGVGLGIAIGSLRFAATPWEGLPHIDSGARSNAALSTTGSPTPIAAIDRLEYDFGSFDMEEQGRQEFTVTNRGKALLKITKGATTCRCTVSDLERSDLPPGESTKIILTWRATAEPGPYRQTAKFYTNDPARLQFTITVFGKITATIRAKPAALVFNRISAKETAHGSVTVLSYLDQLLEIKSHQWDENGIAKYFDLAITPLSETELKEETGAKSGYLLTVSVKPGLPQGPFQQRIVLATNNPIKAELEIPVSGTVGNDISIVGPGWDSEREVLNLGTVKSHEGLSQRLLLIVRGPYRKEVKFKLAEKPPIPLKITVGETSDINNGQVTQTPLMIEIPKGSPQASHLGHAQAEGEETLNDDTAVIQIETTHPEIPKIRIPVRFAVER